MIRTQTHPIDDYRPGDLLVALERPLPAHAEQRQFQAHLARHGFEGAFVGRTDDGVLIRNRAGEVRTFPLASVLCRGRRTDRN